VHQNKRVGAPTTSGPVSTSAGIAAPRAPYFGVLILVPVFFALMKERALRRGSLRPRNNEELAIASDLAWRIAELAAGKAEP